MRKVKAKGSKAKAKPLPIEVNEREFTAVLKKTKHLHHKIAFVLSWHSGMRISEVVNLKPEDFDFGTGQIRINMGKNSKDRIVPIPKIFGKEHLKYIPIKCKQRALQKAFITACELSGLKKKKPKVHFHSLRHGFATQCVRTGVNLPALQGLLGHEDLATTTLYINLCPTERLNEYYEKF